MVTVSPALAVQLSMTRTASCEAGVSSVVVVVVTEVCVVVVVDAAVRMLVELFCGAAVAPVWFSPPFFGSAAVVVRVFCDVCAVVCPVCNAEDVPVADESDADTAVTVCVVSVNPLVVVQVVAGTISCSI